MQRWTSIVKSTKHQIYKSCTQDPFINLSIEHYLLQNSPTSSTILFLYINKPCIVIGRNQNPWLEVNLDLLKNSPTTTSYKGKLYGLRNVELVRRRSGGGAVFHDEGNVNYSVICPPESFTRDKHAEMVTKAIRTFNDRARVNERHDIVLDGGPPLPILESSLESNMHLTKYSQPHQFLKVSGSAYKIVRNRCLHHGTCLVASPNLSAISQHLRSPARPYMQARGVESVRSPVGNASSYESGSPVDKHEFSFIKAHTDRFQSQVVKAFADMYSLDGQHIKDFLSQSNSTMLVRSEDDLATGFIGEQASDVQEVASGIEELKSSSWIYGQTPQFTLSSHAIEEDDRERPSCTPELPSLARVYIRARGGSITDSRISLSTGIEALAEQRKFDDALKGRNIDKIKDFRETLQDIADTAVRQKGQQCSTLIGWLNRMFGKRP